MKIKNYYHHDEKQLLFYKKVHIKTKSRSVIKRPTDSTTGTKNGQTDTTIGQTSTTSGQTTEQCKGCSCNVRVKGVLKRTSDVIFNMKKVDLDDS